MTRTQPSHTNDPVVLAQRLHDGALRIDLARAEGRHAEADRLEEFWLGLLEQYESVCDALATAA